MQLLAPALSTVPSLVCLNLSGNRLDEAAMMQYLVPAIRRLPSLRTLNLSNCKGVDGAAMLHF